ncbi:hypothetical protein [Streptomyces sp. NPDC003036]|uniref:hypothetical protein n=1 Tax=Streptomyces sp. NPDC003036 TaxID=3154442 RepID=UPI0033B8E25C
MAGARPKHDLVFADRVLVTLVHLRTGLPHAVLAAYAEAEGIRLRTRRQSSDRIRVEHAHAELTPRKPSDELVLARQTAY